MRSSTRRCLRPSGTTVRHHAIAHRIALAYSYCCRRITLLTAMVVHRCAGGAGGWFLGSFWWNWNTDDGHFAPVRHPRDSPSINHCIGTLIGTHYWLFRMSLQGSDDCLTPQWKPAEHVLRHYYRAVLPQPAPPAEPAVCMGAGACTC